MLVISPAHAEAGKDSGKDLILSMAQGGEEWTKMGQVYVRDKLMNKAAKSEGCMLDFCACCTHLCSSVN